PLGARRVEGEGDGLLVGLDLRSPAGESAQPDRGQFHVADLVVVYPLEDLGGFRIPHAREGVAVEEAEVEVRLLEGEAHGAEEGLRPLRMVVDARDELPEVVGEDVVLEAMPQAPEPLHIEAEVRLLLREGVEEAPPQGLGHFGPAEEGPSEEFDRHQLVVGEAGEGHGPGLLPLEFTELRQLAGAASEAELGGSRGAVDVEGGAGIVVREIDGLDELALQIAGLEDVQAELPDRHEPIVLRVEVDAVNPRIAPPSAEE